MQQRRLAAKSDKMKLKEIISTSGSICCIYSKTGMFQEKENELEVNTFIKGFAWLITSII